MRTIKLVPELRGKFKLRITEIAVAPGGYVGEHNFAPASLQA